MRTEIENGTTSGAASAPVAEITLLDVLIVLAKAKKRIGIVTAAVAVVAAIVSLLLPSWYTATSQIMPPQESPSVAALLSGQLGGLAGAFTKDFGLKNPSDIYVTMLQSRTVEDALVQRFELQKIYREKRFSDARRKLEKVSTIVAGKEGVISISVEDKDPKRAAEMANAYVAELRALTQDVAVSESSQRRLFFQRQLEIEKNALADAEVALKQVSERTGMVQPEAQTRATLQTIVHLRAAISAKETELSALRSFGTEQNPKVRAAESQLASLRSQLVAMEKQQPQTPNLEIPTKQLPEAALEYIRRYREVKYHEALFEMLAKQFEAARVDESKNATVIQVIDQAVAPDKRSFPKRTMIVLVSTIGAFLLMSLWALFEDRLSRAREVPESRVRLEMLRSYLFS